jgi:hypothetical protein
MAAPCTDNTDGHESLAQLAEKNGLMAGDRRVALRGKSENCGIAAFNLGVIADVCATTRQISNDRKSGERRGAGLKSCSYWGDEDKKHATGMLDRPGNDRHRQLWWGREERRRRQMHNGANRAVIVAVVVVML